MTAREIIAHLCKVRFRETKVVPNYTPRQWWECDVFEVTKTGYMREYEVKVTRGDFFADAKKEMEEGPYQFGVIRPMVKKHDLLAAGDPRGPSAFYYVTPPGLIQPHELPVWAGLIEIEMREVMTYVGGGYGKVRRLVETEVKKAPRLHRVKCDEAILKHAVGVCYYRMHNYLTGTPPADELAQPVEAAPELQSETA